MPRPNTKPSARAAREQAARFETNEQVLITQVVGSVMPSSDGTMTILAAAYMEAAEYIANNAGDEAIYLTWDINGHHFSTEYAPKRDNGQPMDVPAY